MNLNFYEYFQQVIDQYAARMAVQWYDEQRKKVVSKTYANFRADVLGFAGALQQRFGGAWGKHIGVYAKNSYAYIVCVFGILYSGNVAVLLNYNEGSEQTRDELIMADVDTVLADGVYLEKLRAVCEPVAIPAADMAQAVQNTAEYRPVEDRNADKLALLVFTSGTSGKNKCVMLTVGNLFACCKELSAEVTDTNQYVKFSEVCYFVLLPMYHVMALAEVVSALYCGDRVDLELDIRNMYRDIAYLGSNYAYTVPAIFDRWYLDIVSGHKERLGTIRGLTCAGALIDSGKVHVFEEAGIAVSVAYGMTETCATGTFNCTLKNPNFLSVGKFAYGELKVDFVQGEICLKGASITPGYYKDPEATAEAIQDGWLHTGDLGYMDEEGYLYITGRKKNLIILASGENVSPEELEGLLLKNESILEVLVKEKNDRICAEIYCDVQMQDAIEAYINQVNKSLPYYKQIVLTEYRTEPFERTASGKIKR